MNGDEKMRSFRGVAIWPKVWRTRNKDNEGELDKAYINKSMKELLKEALEDYGFNPIIKCCTSMSRRWSEEINTGNV
jgi:hypothetical protein